MMMLLQTTRRSTAAVPDALLYSMNGMRSEAVYLQMCTSGVTRRDILLALDLKEGYWPTDPNSRMIETRKIVAVRPSLFRELLD